ncbi:DUF305 domain-containing protein [Streptomyces sp. NPDC004647]|uniref:DUF305 domain-containing protein n=1 Tax=Streptomyces sp. NPDC004647 TaxID=3154671 RepID=UPI0033A86E43
MTAHRSLIRRAAVVTAAVAAAMTLTACGGGDASSAGHDGHGKSSSPTTTSNATASAERGGHNAADVSFAQGMIPHHRQAVEMAEIAETRADSPAVRTLAEEIKKAQDPEIRTMSGWLASWGEQTPSEGAGGGHAGHSMSGMMTPEEMDRMEKASGKAFETAFLRMMVKHHEGAVQMAATEKSEGSYQPAKDTAEDIITSQTAEITEINRLLGKN